VCPANAQGEKERECSSTNHIKVVKNGMTDPLLSLYYSRCVTCVVSYERKHRQVMHKRRLVAER
jgi:hypothetical protein